MLELAVEDGGQLERGESGKAMGTSGVRQRAATPTWSHPGESPPPLRHDWWFEVPRRRRPTGASQMVPLRFPGREGPGESACAVRVR